LVSDDAGKACFTADVNTFKDMARTSSLYLEHFVVRGEVDEDHRNEEGTTYE